MFYTIQLKQEGEKSKCSICANNISGKSKLQQVNQSFQMDKTRTSKHRLLKEQQWPPETLWGAAVFSFTQIPTMTISNFSPSKKRQAGKGTAKGPPAEKNDKSMAYIIQSLQWDYMSGIVLCSTFWFGGNNLGIAQYWPWNRYSGLWKPCYSTKQRQRGVLPFRKGRRGKVNYYTMV